MVSLEAPNPSPLPHWNIMNIMARSLWRATRKGISIQTPPPHWNITVEAHQEGDLPLLSPSSLEHGRDVSLEEGH